MGKEKSNGFIFFAVSRAFDSLGGITSLRNTNWKLSVRGLALGRKFMFTENNRPTVPFCTRFS